MQQFKEQHSRELCPRCSWRAVEWLWTRSTVIAWRPALTYTEAGLKETHPSDHRNLCTTGADHISQMEIHYTHISPLCHTNLSPHTHIHPFTPPPPPPPPSLCTHSLIIHLTHTHTPPHIYPSLHMHTPWNIQNYPHTHTHTHTHTLRPLSPWYNYHGWLVTWWEAK